MDCSLFPELDLGRWGDQLQARLNGRRYPLGGLFELTERCNLTCAHCYINQAAACASARKRELTTAQARLLLDQAAEAGCLFLVMTGGEPLVRPDFLDIYHHARRCGIIVSLFTNATLVTPRIADALADVRPQVVDISLYGATAATYEAVTGVAGSYERFRRGTDLLLARGLRVTLKSVIMKANRHELAAMRALADDWGVKFRYDGLLWPRLDGGEQPYEQRLSVDDLLMLDQNDAERQQAWDEVARQFSGQLARSEYVYSCGAGLQSFHLDSYGRMCICTMARQPSYDALRIGFAEAWERIGDLRQRKRTLDTACLTCTAAALCLQCPGWSQAVHGDDETPVRFICEMGRRRQAKAQRSVTTQGEGKHG